MSVPQGKRKESNLKYVQDAHILAQHTLQLCDNENHFPDVILAKAIKHEALEILCNARYNLATYTYEKENKQLLKRYVCDILAHIDALYGLLELAYNNKNCHLTADTMEYWIGLVINVENSVKKLGLVPICWCVLRSPRWAYACYGGSSARLAVRVASPRSVRPLSCRTVRNLTVIMAPDHYKKINKNRNLYREELSHPLLEK